MKTDIAMPNACPMPVARRAEADGVRPETYPSRLVLRAHWSGQPLRCRWVAADSEQSGQEITAAA